MSSTTQQKLNFEDIYTYSTDINGSWKQKGPYNKNYSLFQMIKIAFENNSNILVKTSTGSWYIKNIGLNKDKKEIVDHIEKNISINFKPKSRTYLIDY